MISRAVRTVVAPGTITLYLFSELPLCVSCTGLVPQFQKAYPGQHSQSKSLSAAAGVSAGHSSDGGLAVGVTGSMSASRGRENGEVSTQLNTHLNAGAQFAILNDGDTMTQASLAVKSYSAKKSFLWRII